MFARCDFILSQIVLYAWEGVTLCISSMYFVAVVLSLSKTPIAYNETMLGSISVCQRFILTHNLNWFLLFCWINWVSCSVLKPCFRTSHRRGKLLWDFCGSLIRPLSPHSQPGAAVLYFNSCTWRVAAGDASCMGQMPLGLTQQNDYWLQWDFCLVNECKMQLSILLWFPFGPWIHRHLHLYLILCI